jgi:transposase
MHYLGIDIAKDKLDIDGRAQPLPNTPEHCAEWLATLPSDLCLVCEATGGYERTLVAAAHLAKIPIAVVNPLQVRRFAGALGRLAKTDLIDKQVLTRFGAALQPRLAVLPAPALQRLAELTLRRRQLTSLITGERQRSAALASPLLQAQAEALLTLLTAQRAALEAELIAVLAATPELQAKAERLQAVQGVGLITTAGLLGVMPELGQLSSREAAALAGVAPMNRDSGRYRGQQHIAGGRPLVRALLYMAAVAAVRCNPVLKPFYQGLRARGKSARQALTAVMRKLIVLLNRLLADPLFALVR